MLRGIFDSVIFVVLLVIVLEHRIILGYGGRDPQIVDVESVLLVGCGQSRLNVIDIPSKSFCAKPKCCSVSSSSSCSVGR